MRRAAPIVLLLLIASMPLHARETWVQVCLPDGRTGWAPVTAVLAPATSPQSPERVLEVARMMLGAPYVWGGESPNGADCSGFVQEVYRLAGHRLPRLADAQFEATAEVPAEEAQPGDLVFFTTYLPGPSHVGIYLGDNLFVHAPRSGARVRIEDMSDRYWSRRYNGARRIQQ